MKVVLLGHQKWACLTLEELAKHHHVLGVVTETDEFERIAGDYYDFRKRYGVYGDLKKTSQKIGIPIFQPENINESNLLDELNPDLVVSVSYHSIIKPPLLKKYPFINAHAAPLPRYRGRAPIQWAIINGEKKGAVTVHYMAPIIDQGNILAQEYFEFGPDDNSIEALSKSLPLFPKLVMESIRKIEKKDEGVAQDETQSTYFSSLQDKDLLVDWNLSALRIHNLIRGAYPTHKAYSYFSKGKVSFEHSKIVEDFVNALPGTVYRKNNEGFFVKAGDNKSLLIKPNYKIKLGDRLWIQ